VKTTHDCRTVEESPAQVVTQLPLQEIGPAVDPAVEIARCFLRVANLPNFALDRLSRYEATLWRQLDRPYIRSMLWIAASHKIEDAAFVSMSRQPGTRFTAVGWSTKTIQSFASDNWVRGDSLSSH
jgi:hypothetical protein